MLVMYEDASSIDTIKRTDFQRVSICYTASIRGILAFRSHRRVECLHLITTIAKRRSKTTGSATAFHSRERGCKYCAPP
jgi:hypothetical protein